jgi:hypothetical protein
MPPQEGFQKFYDEGLEENTIAVRLQQAGYRTVLFGTAMPKYDEMAIYYGSSSTHPPFR